MHVVFDPTGKSASWFDGPEFFSCLCLIDNVQLALKNEAGRWRDVTMVHAASTGLEFDDHIRRTGRHVDIEQFVVTAGGDEVFPVHFFGIEAEVP